MARPYRFFAAELPTVKPEATEQARCLIAFAVPVALAVMLAWIARRRSALPERLLRLSGAVIPVGTVGLLAACVVAQQSLRYGHRIGDRIFSPATLVVAAALALVTAALARSGLMTRHVGERSSGRAVRFAAGALAIVYTAGFLLHAINSDHSILWANPLVALNIAYPLDETFAVVNGRTPLVDFTAQYGSLWPYPLALSLVVFGKGLLAFTIASCALSTVALAAVYGVLRRVTRSAVAALVLYLPFVATSLFQIDPPPANRSTPASYMAVFPLRYAGPLLLAGLTARHLDGARPRRAWLLFAAAGLVVLNNVEFGLAAVLATGAALIWTSHDTTARRVVELARDAAIGLLLALVVVAAATLARSGSLLDLGRLVDYARLYSSGYHMVRLPGVLGLHFACYVTYAAALVVATARAVDRAANRVLTGMLAWSAVFGFGASSYFVGQSGDFQLKCTFAAWALSIVLLTVVVVVQRLAQDRPRLWRLDQLAVLFGMGLLVCSLAQTPLPWTQLDRVRRPDGVISQAPPSVTPYLPLPATRSLFASAPYGARFYAKRGLPVAILAPSGHRTADVFGIVDVSRYTGIYSIHTVEALREVVDDLRRAGGNTLLVTEANADVYRLLASWGFVTVTAAGLRPYAPGRPLPTARVADGTLVTKWVDSHDLHPAFLRRGRGAPVRSL